MSSQEHRLYNVKDGQPYFCTGTRRDGRQVLMGIQWPEMVAVVFSPGGEFEQLLVCAMPSDLAGPLSKEADRELNRWQAELGFLPSPIHIEKFFLPDRFIGIKDLPEHYQDVLDNPTNYDSDELSEFQIEIAKWLAQRDFVLYWNEDYYLDESGEVVSS